MPGTETGPSYLAFARKGSFALGVKPSFIAHGSRYGAAGHTYFALRLRSAPAGGLFDHLPAPKVVKLQAQPQSPASAWDGVTWEKADASRASTTIGVMLPGEFKGAGEEGVAKVLEAVQTSLASKTAEYLVGLAQPENLVATSQDIAAWIDEQYAPIVKEIVENLKAKKAVETEVKAHIGTFSMTAALLKKAYGASQEDPKS